MLLEVLFRWALLIYSDKVPLSKDKGAEASTASSINKMNARVLKTSAQGKNAFSEVSTMRAFSLFIQLVLKPFGEKLQLRW